MVYRLEDSPSLFFLNIGKSMIQTEAKLIRIILVLPYVQAYHYQQGTIDSL